MSCRFRPYSFVRVDLGSLRRVLLLDLSCSLEVAPAALIIRNISAQLSKKPSKSIACSRTLNSSLTSWPSRLSCACPGKWYRANLMEIHMNQALLTTCRVEIQKAAVQKTSKNQNSYTLQEAYAHLPDHPYPERFEFFPPREVPGGYAPGMYVFDVVRSLRVRQGRLEIGDFHLMTAPQGGASSASQTPPGK